MLADDRAPGFVEEIVAAELAVPVEPAAGATAERLADAWGPAVAAVLFHGSCLREGVGQDRILDLYLLVDDYRSAHASILARLANAALPPNVYYAETEIGERTVRAKYAVLSLPALERRTRRDAFHPYFWARFCQPCALPRVRDDETRRRIIASVTRAAVTMIEETRPLLDHPPPARELWLEAFRQTYRAELRSERASRGEELYASDRERYDRIAKAVLAGVAPPSPGARRCARLRWSARRMVGKILSVLRLLKAAFTFEGGADYVIWKIRRHAKVGLELSPWQRRHPILAAPWLFWRLYRRGGFR